MIIPATIDGKPVTDIAYNAFRGCTGLTSITIPPSVTSIEDGAFKQCTGLTSITIPAGVSRIYSDTFYGCSGLTSITFPSNVSYIGDEAFRGCTGLTSIAIPPSVKYIESGVFNGCTGLTSVTIPASVTSIGDSAFSGCTGLTGITIPSSVSSILDNAFRNCYSLSKAIFEGNAPTIKKSSFDQVADTFKIYYSDGKIGFTVPTWHGHPTVLLINRPEITIQQPANKFLINGSSDIDFGSVVIGKSSPLKTFTIKNIGIEPLKGFAIKLNGAHAKDFIVTKIRKSSLASGASATFKVGLKPSAKGRRRAAIHIQSNDADENPFTIKLHGYGIKQPL